MVTAMILAHLVGDYLLQWDSLAGWKAREYKGVLMHCTIVLGVTVLFALAFDPGFWPWALLIGGLHTLIDAAPIWLQRRWPGLPLSKGMGALVRLVIDQLLHGTVIVLALAGGGYLAWGSLWADLHGALTADPGLALVLGYVFISLPAWIVVEFAVFGLIRKTPPDFAASTNRYVGVLERGLITTFVLLGQFVLMPLVVAPRLLLEQPMFNDRQQRELYVAELLASVSLALMTGLWLRGLL